MNGTFSPLMSTNEVYRDTDRNRCLTLDLEDLESAVSDLENGKADSDHTHTGYSASDHNHDSDYIAKALQFLSDDGNYEFAYGASSGVNMLTTIGGWPQGMHTAYFGVGLTGNPKTTEAWRVFCHKTSVTTGWILAFGTSGSIYSNYLYGENTFRGWRCIVDAEPGLLWSGAKYMHDTQTITPSKPLSSCRNGWMLEWSDYDKSTGTANNYNIVHTPIYKRNVVGNWNGNAMMFAIPTFIASDGTGIIIANKQLLVFNDKLTGHAINDDGNANTDVVLRAVYEF